jgi:hypothetical protein
MRPVTPRAALATLLCAACCAACAGAEPRPAPAPGPPQSYGAQVLELRDAALVARDLEGATRAYDPDAVVIDADSGQVVLRGRAEIRAALERFFRLCPRPRLEVLDRSYQERGRIVTDVERVTCERGTPVQGWVRYEISGGAIVRVLKHRSPPFGG